MAHNTGVKRDIPIKLGDFSVIDSEFSNIRERFDAEMRKMEDEMTKFRSELMNKESNFFKTTSNSQNTISSNHSDLPASRLTGATPSGWVESINSPLIQEDGDNKMLKLRFDVSQYEPEEIVVKTVDNKLLVHAKHEEKSDSKSVYREYNREFLLPKGTNPEAIKSSLSKDGVLTVEAPLPALGGPDKLIPISHH
ncbi:alpha-crystallin B chain isoform X2 [Acyrthosiphon pisum]|uniref:SHSP domain-containing protein n=2 Tax=Aphidinae TaxID=133076 RepID=A0A8R2A300_ACYPI|nr:alpha-crystallin B chain isoform X2 [Acyrthosiphon pisum]XP_022168607.1 alpha-crystallin B chain isoform X2 [Myzus persicae]XP_025201478.1 alpha-crystallin B chain isoform X2 [Melanaphis sacchari]XP_026809112.1 alpha-crystallin B chain isoform X2 [Rhopalosiphum maidis]XP_060842657.1 alpha-crystallin B chain isoform X2 [Rhopalosiphum padi]XP_060863768.1 alpha-crystallin B chain isoform X2 [Metopolophium dirhodum]USU43404.1 heat shock protein 21.9 [Myzus persicae]|eukprot:XP_001949486.2 PREDICTED: alpha-crystallin B chain isoform X2 [Acyrthosiphon pisum]